MVTEASVINPQMNMQALLVFFWGVFFFVFFLVIISTLHCNLIVQTSSLSNKFISCVGRNPLTEYCNAACTYGSPRPT